MCSPVAHIVMRLFDYYYWKIIQTTLSYTVVSHIYAYDRAKTLSLILLIRRKRAEFENESNV